MAKPNLTSEEVTAICTAAAAACQTATTKAKTVRFTWRGKPYVASRTIFRLKVDTPDGQPVACRYE